MAGAEAANPKKVQIPGSDYFIVDADGDGIFSLPDSFEKLEKTDLNHDYYEEASPDTWDCLSGEISLDCFNKKPRPVHFTRLSLLLESLENIGISKLWTASMSHLGEIFRLCNHVRNSPVEDVRRQAMARLYALADPHTFDFLLSTFTDNRQSEDVRSTAALALGKLGDPEGRARPHLISALRAKQGFDRAKIVEALAAIPSHDVLVALGKAYENEENVLIREQIVQAATRLLQTGEDKLTRIQSAHLLGMAQNKSVLATSLLTEQDPGVRFEIVLALQKHLGRSDKSLLPTLVKAFQNETASSVREEIVCAIRSIDGNSTMIKILQTDTHELYRLYAANALGSMGDRSLVPVLFAEYQNETSNSVRAEIKSSLSVLGYEITESETNGHSLLVKKSETSSSAEDGHAPLPVEEPASVPSAQEGPVVPAIAASSQPEKVAGADPKPTFTSAEQIIKYEQLAQAAEKSNLPEDAIAYYEKLIQLDPQNAGYLLKLARLDAQLQKYDEAIKNCGASIKLCEDCDDLAAKRLLPQLKKESAFFNKYSQSIPYIGFFTTDPGFDDGILKTFGDSFLREIKKTKLKVILPDVPEITANLSIPASCTDAECTAEIVGAMGLESGFYGTIDWIVATKKYKFTLNYVRRADASIPHRVTVYASKSEIKNPFKLSYLANQIAQKMLKELKG